MYQDNGELLRVLLDQESNVAPGTRQHWFSYTYQDKLILNTALDLYKQRNCTTEEEFSNLIEEVAKLLSTFYKDALDKHTRKNLRCLSSSKTKTS